jgi:hypothetical protein
VKRLPGDRPLDMSDRRWLGDSPLDVSAKGDETSRMEIASRLR